ncbi:MAG: Crp/Fnr family transcriptional regulator [Bacteroidota bacterium]
MEELPSKVKEKFSGVFEPELIEDMIAVGRPMRVPAGTVILDLGQTMPEMPLVLNGHIRIMRDDEDGHELFLYYIQGGDVCAMSLTCCIQDKASEIRAIAEEDSLLWVVPKGKMDSWISKYTSWRTYVFQAYNSRFDELLDTIDSIAFMRMDERLMKYLLDLKQSKGTYVIEKTHQEIANDLNTSRVVVSRLLKQLEREDRIEMYRNRIEIL